MSVIGELLDSTKKVCSSSIFKRAAISPKLVMIGVLGIILLLVGGILETKSTDKSESVTPPQAVSAIPTTNKNYEDALEAKLANLLSQVNGAGTVAVNITLENGSAQEYAKNVTKESKTVAEKDTSGGVRTTVETKESTQVLLSKENGIDRPVIVREIKPAIKGVLVVAEGAENSIVKANLVRAIEAALGVPSYKITVLPQRK
ncbi:MAG: hypothetical protein H6Q73_570 [Firmicutes bacterium]|nr:hypothetical protein [Bacillota bacterium]